MSSKLSTERIHPQVTVWFENDLWRARSDDPGQGSVGGSGEVVARTVLDWMNVKVPERYPRIHNEERSRADELHREGQKITQALFDVAENLDDAITDELLNRDDLVEVMRDSLRMALAGFGVQSVQEIVEFAGD